MQTEVVPRPTCPVVLVEIEEHPDADALEIAKVGDDVQAMIDFAEEEFREWAEHVVTDLQSCYDGIIRRAKEDIDRYAVEGDRKQTALNFKEFAKSNLGVLFALLDGKDPSEKIWKMLRPEHTPPFATDEN